MSFLSTSSISEAAHVLPLTVHVLYNFFCKVYTVQTEVSPCSSGHGVHEWTMIHICYNYHTWWSFCTKTWPDPPAGIDLIIRTVDLAGSVCVCGVGVSWPELHNLWTLFWLGISQEGSSYFFISQTQVNLKTTWYVNSTPWTPSTNRLTVRSGSKHSPDFWRPTPPPCFPMLFHRGQPMGFLAYFLCKAEGNPGWPDVQDSTQERWWYGGFQWAKALAKFRPLSGLMTGNMKMYMNVIGMTEKTIIHYNYQPVYKQARLDWKPGGCLLQYFSIFSDIILSRKHWSISRTKCSGLIPRTKEDKQHLQSRTSLALTFSTQWVLGSSAP